MSIKVILQNLPRTTTREQWEHFWRTARKFGSVGSVRWDSLSERAALAELIASYAVDGIVYVYQWSRDCDMAEGDRVRKLPATVAAYEREASDFYANAEGPCRMSLMTESDAADFEPTFRDLAFEAFENGRGANAYDVTPETY